MSIAPMNVPTMDPAPPERLVPPTTTAAMTSSSYDTPAFGCPEFIREASRIPLSAASVAERTYTLTRTLQVRIPARRAASMFPPTA